MTYYDLFCVPPESNPQDIKAMFSRLMLQHHPDHGGDSEQARVLIHAYKILMDPEKRADYDRVLQTQRSLAVQQKTITRSREDLRQSRRLSLQRQVMIRSPRQEAESAELVNYSSGGAQVRVKSGLKKGMQVELSLMEAALPLAVAEVVYHDEASSLAGIRWLKMMWENFPKGFLRSVKL